MTLVYNATTLSTGWHAPVSMRNYITNDGQPLQQTKQIMVGQQYACEQESTDQQAQHTGQERMDIWCGS